MRAVVKVTWKNTSKGWKARLMTTDGAGFDRQGLQPERKLNIEVSNQRRCTGYAPQPGERTVCPEFRKIKKGSQCPECRGKDIYSGYVRGDKSSELDGNFSVYLAQIGQKLKVGVTRSEKIPKRWVEQGADYGAEIASNLSSTEALEEEQRITDEKSISQRIRKENKITAPKSQLLSKKLEELDFNADIVDVQDLTVYPRVSVPKLQRSGVLRGQIRAVKGQIIFTNRVAMAMTSGKTLQKPTQKGVADF